MAASAKLVALIIIGNTGRGLKLDRSTVEQPFSDAL